MFPLGLGQPGSPPSTMEVETKGGEGEEERLGGGKGGGGEEEDGDDDEHQDEGEELRAKEESDARALAIQRVLAAQERLQGARCAGATHCMMRGHSLTLATRASSRNGTNSGAEDRECQPRRAQRLSRILH